MRVRAWLGFAALATIAGVLHELGVLPLIGWVPRPTGDATVPWLLALLVAGHGVQLAVPPRYRSATLLATSLACGLVVSVPFTAFGVGWTLAYRRILWSRLRPAITILFPIFTLAALVALADAADAPARVAAHPWLATVCALFALNWFLRALVVWHEARSGAPQPPVIDVLGYFLFAPYALIPPYMLALPRLALVREGVTRLDPAVQRSGLRWLSYGVALQAALTVVDRLGLSPVRAHLDALQAGDWARAVPLAIVVYPVWAVVTACAAGALLVGLTRSFGVAMGPAFQAPLLARGVADWWRRYNTHFRDLLVDLFWLPIALRYRRRPILLGYLGCAAVFLLGSVPLHWVRPAAELSTPWSFPWNIAAECVVMTLLVGTSLALEHRRKRRRTARTSSPLRTVLIVARTWLAICAVTYALGYGVQYQVRFAPWLALSARLDAVTAPAEAAALIRGLERVVAEHPREPARRAALARALALAGRTDDARHQLALAHAFAAAPTTTLADVRALARADAAIRTLDQE